MINKKKWGCLGLLLLLVIGGGIYCVDKGVQPDSEKQIMEPINPSEFLIDRMNNPIPGVVISPKTTAELKKWFAGSDEDHLPRVFVDKLPADFAKEGNKELFAKVIAALVLRANERILKERFILRDLERKWQKGIKWTPKETLYFNYLVDYYDSKFRKTTEAQLNDLVPKVEKIPPAMAVLQAAEATNWGKENLESPFEQMGWLDQKTYARIPYQSLIEATDNYIREMNGFPALDSWRYIRSKYISEGKTNFGYQILRWIGDYKQSDRDYSNRLYRRMEELEWEISDSLSFIKPMEFEKGTVKIKGQPFSIEFARTPEQKAYGLMFRPNVPADTGMVFLEEHPTEMGVWMKNTFVPLDILFFNGQWRVSQILKGMKPLDETPRRSIDPAKGMIELPAGTVQKYQIRIGDKVSF